MRVALMLLLVTLAGCATTDETTEADLDVYVYWSPYGLDMADSSLDWMVRVANPTEAEANYRIDVNNIDHGSLSLATDNGLVPVSLAKPFIAEETLPAGESHLWVVKMNAWPGPFATTKVFSGDQLVHNERIHVTNATSATVSPGQHVQTMTVGVWTNGTSFYTNMADFLTDAAFPAGGNINRSAAAAGALPLPIYVYDQDRSEQPPASKDTCHFTTIDGYNALLKTQQAGTGNVRFLHPEEAYTRPGAEEHFLYGDPLLFYNVVVAIDGDAHAQVETHDASGGCYDFQNTRDYYGLPTEVPAPPLAELLGF